VSRTTAGAVIEDPEVITERTVRMLKEKRVMAIDGKTVELGDVHTICVHGDNLEAVALAKFLRKGLEKAGVEVASVSKFL
jgi:UPF0271 protein